MTATPYMPTTAMSLTQPLTRGKASFNATPAAILDHPDQESAGLTTAEHEPQRHAAATSPGDSTEREERERDLDRGERERERDI
ncbi:hypothetical protein NPIL_265781 [Nephila pilipes]|uniref:Uncharacterized protein n=1 Tax=Nephila pilipes TaxID=299642 RepID=A0A8X6N8E3_NEPPI|nr:hypothetical protein NPIL_265781 [Nephila pilipes]